MKALILPFCLLAMLIIQADEPKYTLSPTTGTPHFESSKYMVRTAIAYKPITPEELVKELLAAGEVCKVTGHKWEDIKEQLVTDGTTWFTLQGNEPAERRKCVHCGIKQKRVPEWQDEKGKP